MTHKFIPRSYFVYNEKKHAWLSLTGYWTTVFWHACDYDTEDKALAGPWPDADFDDCYVLAWNGTFDRTALTPSS